MPRPPRPDQPLQLIDLDPDQLVHPPVAPHREQLSAKLHCAPSHPESEDTPVWLEGRNGEAAELVVGHCPVWELHYELIEYTSDLEVRQRDSHKATYRHVDVPGRIRHDDLESAPQLLHSRRPDQGMTVLTVPVPNSQSFADRS